MRKTKENMAASVNDSDLNSTPKVRFRWDKGDKVLNLIQCLLHYKVACTYEAKDFNADKPKMYDVIREDMARIYKDEPSLFGPIQIVVDPFCSRPKECLNEEELIEEQKVVQQKKIDVALIKRGYTRIQEKIKEIRQKLSEAVTSGQRSGSGKIVLEFFDQLVQLWGGSPATEPLPSGVSTHGIDKGLPTNAVVDGGGNIDEELGTTLQEDVEIEEEPTTSKLNAKRKSTSPIPQLIDEKRKHLERKLSAAQRDQLLLKEAKEDAHFKRELGDAIRQSNESFSTSIQGMSTAILKVAEGLSKSIEMMATAMLQPQQQLAQPYNIQPQYGHFQHVNNYMGSSGLQCGMQRNAQYQHQSNDTENSNEHEQTRYTQL